VAAEGVVAVEVVVAADAAAEVGEVGGGAPFRPIRCWRKTARHLPSSWRKWAAEGVAAVAVAVVVAAAEEVGAAPAVAAVEGVVVVAEQGAAAAPDRAQRRRARRS